MSDPVRRALRSLLQFTAGGGFAALIAVIADGLSPEHAVLVTAIAATVVAYLQNLLEDNTAFPAVLKAPASDGR